MKRLRQPETPGGNESMGLKRKPTSPALDETLTKRSVYLSNDDDGNRMDTGRITITADVHQPVDSEREREGTAWGATPTAEDDWDAPQPSKRPSSPEVHITIHDSTETQLSDTSKLIASSMRMNAETNIENIDSNTDSSTSCKQVNGATLDIAGELPLVDHKVSDEYCEKRVSREKYRQFSGEPFRILTINVCGLKTRTLYPEFISYISMYDIIGIQETKTDSLDEINLPGCIIRFKHRKKISNVKSGGIGIAYKEKYEQYIHFIDSDSNLVQWFVISNRLTKQNDLLCGVIYIPPESSSYSHHEPYYEISEELKGFEEKYSDILLLGDLNSRTRNMKDFIEIDQSVFHETGLDCVFEDLSGSFQIFEDTCSSVILNRNSSDVSANNYGYKLVDFCKSFSLFI